MPTWLTRPVLSWALYDVASSTYMALVPGLFGVYFVSVVAGGAAGAQGAWGAIAALALLLAGVLSPIVGAWSDQRGRWLGALAVATALCAGATMLMGAGGAGRALAMGAVFAAAQVGYTIATALYDALLVRVAPRTHAGRVSGFGWALGFLGGIASLAAAIVLLRGTTDDAQVARLPAVFLAAGVLYALLAVPVLAGLRGLDVARARTDKGNTGIRAALASVIRTVRNWRSQRNAFRFLTAYYLFNDVLVTLTFFVAIVARERFGLTIEGLLWLSLLYHAIALPATVAFGHAADRWGPRPAIYVTVTILGATLLLLALGGGSRAAMLVTVLLALVFGSLQSVCRSLLALLVDQDRAAELFGFNAFVGRLSAAFGPLLFGVVAAATGSNAAALLSLLPFLAAGAYLLAGVRIPDPRTSVDAPAQAPG